MGRLRGRVDDKVGTLSVHQVADRLAIANVGRNVAEAGNLRTQHRRITFGGTGGTEKDLAHIVIQANNVPSLASQKTGALRPYQAAATRNQNFHRLKESLLNG